MLHRQCQCHDGDRCEWGLSVPGPGERHLLRRGRRRHAAAGYTVTYDNFTGTDGTGRGIVSVGSTDGTVDFGYRNTTGFNVSGNVWNDANGNGVNNAETAIQNVKVCLYQTDGVLSSRAPRRSPMATTRSPCAWLSGRHRLRDQGGYDHAALQRVRPDRRPGSAGVPCTTCDSMTVITVTAAESPARTSVTRKASAASAAPSAPARAQSRAGRATPIFPGVTVLLPMPGPTASSAPETTW